MEIKFSSLHQIDHSENKIIKIGIDNEGKILGDYIQKLLNEITKSYNKQSFEFQRDSTEVRLAIGMLIRGEYENGSEIIAERLLTTEITAQEKIDKLNIEIQKGILFQTITEIEGEKFVIISKADHSEYIDQSDFLLHKGLPWKKKVFKAFIAKIESDNSLSSIFIYDTNSIMSRYWWDDFLELKAKRTDSHNTRTSLDVLDKKIFEHLKKDFPADHTIIRNSTLGYFRSNTEFDLNEYFSSVMDNYSPVDPEFPLKKTKEKILELPEKWDFDSRFTISKEDIKKRAIRKIPLTNEIDLILKNFIEINGTISAYIDEEGEKCIKIKTINGYETFRRNP
jgi:hypothetical protein